MAILRESVGVAMRPAATAEAKLALLEEFQRCSDTVSAAQRAVEWLAVHASVDRTVFAAPDRARGELTCVAGAGVSPRALKRFTLPLENANHPIVAALTNGAAPSITNAKESRVPFFADDSYSVVAVGRSRDVDDPALGLLLISPAIESLEPRPQPGPHARQPRVGAERGSRGEDAETVQWLARTLGASLERLTGHEARSDQDVKLRRERTLLYNIINAATDPILYTNTEGGLIIANGRAENLFSAPEDASEGRRRAVQLNTMFFSAALSRTALGEGEPGRRELLLVDPTEGSDLLFELLSTVANDPREGTGIVSILRNITDLRQAARQIDENYAKLRVAESEVRDERDRLNMIIDSVVDPIVVTDQEGKIALMNAPAERLFTVRPDAGEAAKRVVQANDAHFTSFISGLLSTGWERTRRGEISLGDPNTRKEIPVEALGATILSDVGELTAVVTILHDRTEALERVHLYDQLRLASEELEGKVQSATAELARQNELLRRQALELEQASAAKSQFLANVSHELRTPLNAILGYAAMTLQGVSGDLAAPQRRNLSRIDANARHLLTLINDILDITRIQAGRMPLQVVAFTIPELLREVTTELEPIIVRSGLSVSTKVGGDLLTLKTDRQKVKQILVNLLGNALKFTRRGSVTIRAEKAGSKRVSISVIDTGIGISKMDQAKIFEDFRQVDSGPRKPYGGTGLGLSICRRLTSMLQGTLTVESRLGHGSTFILNIPTILRQ